MSTFRAKKLISDNLKIPTLPSVITRINELIDDPQTGAAEIGAAIAEDAPLVAKVLRIANSAFYGLREPCLSAEQASAVLGLRVLRNVVTQAAVIQQFDHLRQHPGFDIDELWRHAILTSQLCGFIARRCGGRVNLRPDESQVCGLLHDIGKVIMLDGMGGEFLDVVDEARLLGHRLHVVEEQRLGFNHTDIGALLSVRWGLPSAVSAAIQYHHGPREQLETDSVVSLVANANLLAHRVADGELEAALATIDPPTARFLGLCQSDVEDVLEFGLQAIACVEV